jgi:hypothetical protein
MTRLPIMPRRGRHVRRRRFGAVATEALIVIPVLLGSFVGVGLVYRAHVAGVHAMAESRHRALEGATRGCNTTGCSTTTRPFLSSTPASIAADITVEREIQFATCGGNATHEGGNVDSSYRHACAMPEGRRVLAPRIQAGPDRHGNTAWGIDPEPALCGLASGGASARGPGLAPPSNPICERLND